MLPIALALSSLSVASAGGYAAAYDTYVRPVAPLPAFQPRYDYTYPAQGTVYRAPLVDDYRPRYAPAVVDEYRPAVTRYAPAVVDEYRPAVTRYAPPVVPDTYAYRDPLRYAPAVVDDGLRYGTRADAYAVKDVIRAEEALGYAPVVPATVDYAYAPRSSYDTLKSSVYRDAYRKAYSEAISSYATPAVVRPYDVPRYSPSGRSLGEYGMYLPGGGYARSPLAKTYLRPSLTSDYRDAPIKLSDGRGSVGYYERAPLARVPLGPILPSEAEILSTPIPTPVPPPPPMPAAPFTETVTTVMPTYRDEFVSAPTTPVPPVVLSPNFDDVFQGQRAAFSSDNGSETFVKSSTVSPTIAEVSDVEVQDFMQGLKDMEKPSKKL